MARKDTVKYEGAVYHIYQRGNNKEFIFENDNIKTFILKYLKESIIIWNIFLGFILRMKRRLD